MWRRARENSGYIEEGNRGVILLDLLAPPPNQLIRRSMIASQVIRLAASRKG